MKNLIHVFFFYHQMRVLFSFVNIFVLVNFYTNVTCFKSSISNVPKKTNVKLCSVLLPEKKKSLNKQNFKLLEKSVDVNDRHIFDYKLQIDNINFPMWKVILIKNDNYDKKQVINKILDTLPCISNKECIRYYNQAQSKGSADIFTAPREHAEFYVFQLMNNEPIVYSRCVPK